MKGVREETVRRNAVWGRGGVRAVCTWSECRKSQLLAGTLKLNCDELFESVCFDATLWSSL